MRHWSEVYAAGAERSRNESESPKCRSMRVEYCKGWTTGIITLKKKTAAPYYTTTADVSYTVENTPRVLTGNSVQQDPFGMHLIALHHHFMANLLVRERLCSDGVGG